MQRDQGVCDFCVGPDTKEYRRELLTCGHRVCNVCMAIYHGCPLCDDTSDGEVVRAE